MAKIVRFYETGEPDVLRIEDRSVPDPGEGEVRLQVRAIGLNRAEAAFRRGKYLEAPQLPAGLGYEASGIVDAIGPGVEGFAPGAEVSVIPAFSMNDYSTYADHAIVPARALIEKPKSMSWSEGASVWMQFMTAWGALASIAHLTSGDAVLINAASSSVGLAAIQLVNNAGGTSIALTRTSEKRDALLAAGAAHVIASSETDLAKEVAQITGEKGARIVFDPVLGPGIATLASAMAEGGIYFLYGSLSSEATPFPLAPAMQKHLTFRAYTLFEIVADAQRFEEGKRYISAGLKSGSLKPIISKEFPFEQIVEAHRYLESNQQIGKIIVTVDS